MGDLDLRSERSEFDDDLTHTYAMGLGSLHNTTIQSTIQPNDSLNQLQPKLTNSVPTLSNLISPNTHHLKN